jgi:hypothetical protein
MNESKTSATQAGIWIDHSRAVLIELFPDETERTRSFRSEVERGAKSQGGAVARADSPRVTGANHRRLEERRRNALRSFYRRVWSAAAGDDEIIILGPGLAPGELAKAADDRPGRIREVRALGDLTEAQLRARIRDFFGRSAPRRGVTA